MWWLSALATSSKIVSSIPDYDMNNKIVKIDEYKYRNKILWTTSLEKETHVRISIRQQMHTEGYISRNVVLRKIQDGDSHMSNNINDSSSLKYRIISV